MSHVRRMLVGALLVAGCGSKLPETRYYALGQPGAPTAAAASTGAEAGGAGVTLALEPLETDAGYDDERIVYRANAYRLDYYQYHRWSAAPGVLVENYLEQALAQSGRFASVVRDVTPDSPVVLGGRVMAIEEVDQSPTRWSGRIVVQLKLSDAQTGELLWTQRFDESEPLTAQTPEGLAKAISTAMARIAERAGPKIAEITLQRRHRVPSNVTPAIPSVGRGARESGLDGIAGR